MLGHFAGGVEPGGVEPGGVEPGGVGGGGRAPQEHPDGFFRKFTLSSILMKRCCSHVKCCFSEVKSLLSGVKCCLSCF